MYPHLMSQIAAEHIQDMRKQATETGVPARCAAPSAA